MRALELLEDGNAEDAEKLLSDAQKAAFREALRKGELSIEYWTPWWATPLVGGAEDSALRFPPPPQNVVPLAQKMKGKPLHESVRNNIPELMYLSLLLALFFFGSYLVILDWCNIGHFILTMLF